MLQAYDRRLSKALVVASKQAYKKWKRFHQSCISDRSEQDRLNPIIVLQSEGFDDFRRAPMCICGALHSFLQTEAIPPLVRECERAITPPRKRRELPSGDF